MPSAARHADTLSRTEAAARAARAAWAAAQPGTLHGADLGFDDDAEGVFESADADDDTAADSQPPPPALQRLMARLQRQPDFLATQAQVRRVNAAARNERAHVRALAGLLADDPALAAKVLRLTNAAYYRSVGGGQIESLARAVQVMGFDTVQRLATSQRLLDHVPRGEAGLLLREDMLRAQVAGRLGAELCPVVGGQESAHVLAMFQNLGRLLLAAHLGDDALAIRAAVPRHTQPLAAAEQAACRRQLGVDYGQIGAHVARGWGWPDALVNAMRHRDWPLRRPRQRAQQLVWQGWLANEAADLLLYTDPARWPEGCELLSRRTFSVCGQGSDALRRALARVRQHLEDLAESVGLPLDLLGTVGGARTAPGAPLAESAAQGGVEAVPPRSACGTPSGTVRIGAGGASVDLDPTEPAAPLRSPDDDAPLPGLQALAQAAARLSADLLHPRRRAEVPQRALAALLQGLRARRAVMCLPEAGPAAAGAAGTAAAGQPLLSPRLVLGQALPPQVMAAWRVAPAQGRDLFSRLCAQAADGQIDDARQPALARHLPPGFREQVDAAHFVVLPMQAQGRPLGMIYLDRAPGDPFTLDGDELQLVRALRNQVAIALTSP